MRIIPSTPEEDLAEMRRMYAAQLKAKYPPYHKGARLKASGGCYRRAKR